MASREDERRYGGALGWRGVIGAVTRPGPERTAALQEWSGRERARSRDVLDAHTAGRDRWNKVNRIYYTVMMLPFTVGVVWWAVLEPRFWRWAGALVAVTGNAVAAFAGRGSVGLYSAPGGVRRHHLGRAWPPIGAAVWVVGMLVAAVAR